MGKEKPICPICGKEVGFWSRKWGGLVVKRFGKPEWKDKKFHISCFDKAVNKIKDERDKKKIEEYLAQQTDNWSKKVYIYTMPKLAEIFDDFWSAKQNTRKNYEWVIEVMLSHGYTLQSHTDSSGFWLDLSDVKFVFVKKD